MTAIRRLAPGEHLSDRCGSHCGIRSAADEGGATFIGHCPCDQCACPEAFAEIMSAPGPADSRPQGVPMCDSWRPANYYE